MSKKEADAARRKYSHCEQPKGAKCQDSNNSNEDRDQDRDARPPKQRLSDDSNDDGKLIRLKIRAIVSI